MAELLGRTAIGDAWKQNWSEAFTGKERNSCWFTTVKRALSTREEVRREPLTVRVAVDLILEAEPDKRQSVVDEIREMKDDQGKTFAAHLYERRILYNVRNENAEKLAWPGLVLRRDTLEIALDFLADLCELSKDDVPQAFRSLGEEVWMVARDGEALKHRPELRARTLPLMRGHAAEKFDRIAAAAVVYFEGLKDRSREHRAEWIYHRLLSGSDIEDVAPDITPEMFQALAGAEEHFGRNSEAASYIASRCQCIFLEPYEIDGLTRPILRTHTYWIARITPSLSDFQKAEILPHYLPAFAGDWSGGEPGMRSTVQALAIARLCKSSIDAATEKKKKQA